MLTVVDDQQELLVGDLGGDRTDRRFARLKANTEGVGDLIDYHRSVAEYSEMYAAVFSIIAFSAITVGLLEQAEIRFFRPEKKVGR